MFNFTKNKVMMFDREKMLQLCNDWSKNTLMNTLEIVYTDAGEDFLTATMPVNPRVHQPMGLLHGGATVALAESSIVGTNFLKSSVVTSFKTSKRIVPSSSLTIGSEKKTVLALSLIHISEPTRRYAISSAVFCLKKKIGVNAHKGNINNYVM